MRLPREELMASVAMRQNNDKNITVLKARNSLKESLKPALSRGQRESVTTERFPAIGSIFAAVYFATTFQDR
jgi:hypothetical protein